MGEYMRRLFEEGDRAAEREWRTAEYEIARVNNELVKAQKRIAELEAELDYAARLIDCKCGKRDLVLNELRELGSLHAENLCPKDQSCLAILAAELRAVKEGKKNA